MKEKPKAIPAVSAQAQKDQVVIGLISWPGAFVLGCGTTRQYKRKLSLERLQPPRRYKGKLYYWRLLLWECDATAEKPVWYIPTRGYGWLPGVKTEAEAQAALKRQVAADEAEYLRWRAQQKPPTEDDQRLYRARLKVLARPHSVTVRLLREIDSQLRVAALVGFAPDVDALRRQAVAAWRVEMVKLCGADTVTVSTNRELAEVIADAIRRDGKPEDRVDYELAANWKDKGYNNMSTEQYARAVAAVVGKTFTPKFVELVKQRRRRLGLKTLRRRGPADNLGQF